jgi:hypothetical protein
MDILKIEYDGHNGEWIVVRVDNGHIFAICESKERAEQLLDQIENQIDSYPSA